MKLVSFVREGRSGYGVVSGDQVRDVSARLAATHADLKSVLADSNGLAAVRAAEATAPSVPLTGLTLLPVIPNPSKIICIGQNYDDHRAEMGRPKPTHPPVFLRFADSQVGHGQDAWIPAVSTSIDYEGELAVVIGKGGRRISAADALSHVAGYSCYNDISVRDWQRHTTQFAPGKNFPRTGAFGPWLVTADEIADPQALDLTTRLNGDVMQHASTALMTFNVRAIIEYCSGFTPLSPGDVIVSGTPGGVGAGRQPPVFMKARDVVEVEISSIGVLRTRLVPEP